MADEPTRNGADGASAGDPSASGARAGRPATGGGPPAPLTVQELIARSGSAGVGRRRAERRGAMRRGATPAPGRPQPADPAPRTGPPAPPVLPTGWQPAMPSTPAEDDETPAPAAPEPLAGPPVRWPAGTELAPEHRPAAGPRPPARPAPPSSGPAAAAAPSSPPFPVPPRPSAMPTGPSVPPPPPVAPPSAHAAPAAVPDRPRPTPTPTPRPRPAVPAAAPPAAPPRPPAPAQPRPVPAFPGGAHPSAPVPGVRRSLPIPPIPGLDVPAGGSTAADPGPDAERPPPSPRRRRLTRVAVALATLLGLVLAYHVALYFYVDRTIGRVDALVTDGPEVLAPELQESSQTYLVVGTDLPGRSGLAAVSTLIAHVSADGERATLVSVPPTAATDTPACRTGEDDVRPPVTEPFAAALLDGGPSCLVRSVQQLTGLRVDHYLAVDLGRLPGLVDALGGVAACPAAGTGRLTGDQAREYLADSTGPNGTDVTGATAAEREQQLLAATLGPGLSAGMVADPVALARFLTRSAGAFTVDADTTLAEVRTLASALGDLTGDAVQTATVPVAEIGHVPADGDQAAVVVDGPATRALFDAVIDTGRLPEGDPADTGGAPAPAGAPPAPAVADPVPEGTTVTVVPAAVGLDVLDATGTGRTAEVADALFAQGFRVGARGTEPAAVTRTVVRYGAASLELARTVAAAVPGAVLVETEQEGGGVQLVIGPDYAGLATVDIGTPVPPSAAPTAPSATSSCG